MEYMVLLYSDEGQRPDFEPGTPEFEQMMAAWMTYNQELIDGGHFVTAANLATSDTATVLSRSFEGTETLVDGPYAETKEQLGGFYLVEAADLDEAIALARGVPIPVGSFEVRPVAFRPGAG